VVKFLQGKSQKMLRKKTAKAVTAVCVTALILFSAFSALSSCDLYHYGQLGGADKTDKLLPGDPGFGRIMSALSGVWYSHYAGIGRLDGYRIGRGSDFNTLVTNPGKAALFPNRETPEKTYTGAAFTSGDYFVLYDDTVYGQAGDDGPGQESWGFSYCGIVRAINIFNGDPNRGAVIIEYLSGCAPRWLEDTQGLADGERPFFGIFYRRLSPDIIQMANAVDLAALYRGQKYYTETADLDEAIAKNNIENEAEFISWGVVIPQDRE
jgi:hypothetical protein